MVWDNSKTTEDGDGTVDSDEQLSADEWNQHVTDGHFPADEVNFGVDNGDPVMTDPQNADEVIARYDRSEGAWVFTAVNTENLNNDTKFVFDSSDISKIENASTGDRIVIMTSIIEVDNLPIDVPENVTVDGRAVGGAQLKKAAAGDLVTVRSDSTFRHIDFNANQSAGYTGDGVVDAIRQSAGEREIEFEHCSFRNAEGHNRVENASKRLTYIDCTFSGAVGYGLYQTRDGSQADSPRRNTYIACESIDNGAGGVYVGANNPRSNNYWIRCQNNQGPGYVIANSGEARQLRIKDEMAGNDGPAILIDNTGKPTELHLYAGFANNTASPNSALSTPVGDIHAESMGNTFDLYVHEGYQDVGATGTLWSNQSSGKLRMHVLGGRKQGGSIAGDIRGRILCADNGWDSIDMNNFTQGTLIHALGTATPYVQDLGVESKIYTRPLGADPHTANGSWDAYIDRDNGVWKFDSGTWDVM